MRYRYLIIVAIALFGIFVIGNITNAYGDDVTPSPSPSSSSSPSVEPTPTPSPVSHATVVRVQHVQRAAKRALKRLNFARSCFNLKPVKPRFKSLPREGINIEARWTAYGLKLKHMTREYKRKYQRLWDKARHPGGSSNGVRWMPLARWAGWPESQLSHLASIIMRESSGREHAKNPTSTASGLGQFLAFWWDGSDSSIRKLFKKYHLSYPWNPFDAYQTLLHWWAVVREEGWGPWAL